MADVREEEVVRALAPVPARAAPVRAPVVDDNFIGANHDTAKLT